MKTIKLLTFFLLTILISCNLNFYGDIDLGADFYYMVEPAFNSIVTPVDKKKPYNASTFIIREVETIGVNNDKILVTSIVNDTLKYWVIDKTKESKELGYDKKSNLRLSNVTQIDSIGYAKIQKEENIIMKTKSDYRKKSHYE
ncbi:MAG: hypothetical protein FD155_2379 [Bacteroidetes bacterium]|nr:MAG: hypothetical protein FD155_2379 [Bacteroidota bacterium]